MINYVVDEDKKIVVCKIGGPELKRVIDNILNKQIRNIPACAVNLFTGIELDREYVGVAKYHKVESVEFTVKRGKEIARKKAFEKLNKDILKALKAIDKQLVMLVALMRQDIDKYQQICQDIAHNISQY